jgi:hypothetical protein
MSAISRSASCRSRAPAFPAGQRVEVWPANPELIQAGDIVVADVGKRTFLHRVSRVDRSGARIEIADARSHQRVDQLRRNPGHLRLDRRPADPRRDCQGQTVGVSHRSGRTASRRCSPRSLGTSEGAPRKRGMRSEREIAVLLGVAIGLVYVLLQLRALGLF